MENAQLADWEMVTISSHENADIKGIYTQHGGILATVTWSYCHQVMIRGQKQKSSNRAIQAMALGLPVVAYPIQLRRVIRNGWNGFLCREDKDWLGALSKLRDDRFRREME